MTDDVRSSGDRAVHCAVCGKDLTDPKNSGDPDENGDWVCTDSSCRASHQPEISVRRTVIRA